MPEGAAVLKVNQIKLPLNHSKNQLKEAIVHKLRIRPEEMIDYRILKQSIDARKSGKGGHAGEVLYQYSVAVTLANEKQYLKKHHANKDILPYTPVIYQMPVKAADKPAKPPVIIGSGPAGLFCGLMLARQGYDPIILERGSEVHTRMEKVNAFWAGGKLDKECNVQFGEGGAGTFSDGKLNTLVKDPFGRQRKVMETFVEAGAPEDILYVQKPHVGTDLLVGIVERLRNEILSLGGQVHFDSKVTDFVIDAQNHIRGVIVNDREKIEADQVVLAVGHSARDTFEKLLERKISMEPKPFAVGVRVEHPQSMINASQYGSVADQLPAASYKLTYRTGKGRQVYTFCMCPGGYVVNASSEEGMCAVNGMSNRGRDGANANSAVIVGVSPEDFGSSDILAGMAFQRKWEKLAYEEGRGLVPVQLFDDFKEKKVSERFGAVKPEHKGGYHFGNLWHCLPTFVCESLVEGIDAFGRKIKGYDRPDAILSGVETRTSSPVRIPRDEHFESNVGGLYPCGEGAGYAGGITSAAMDGLRVAEAVAAAYAAVEQAK